MFIASSDLAKSQGSVDVRYPLSLYCDNERFGVLFASVSPRTASGHPSSDTLILSRGNKKGVL